MKIGPKYKIARRLGAPIFEKTQSNKYALSEERKSKGRRGGQRTDYGLQLIEKQKARFFYGLSEKQFKNYVKKCLEDKKTSPVASLYSRLESRLDNVVWRMGLAKTHSAGRQMVAHGHICIKGKRVYTPSYEVREGDVISVREGSKKSPLFNPENSSEIEVPAWISYDKKGGQAVIKGKPVKEDKESLFDLGQVIEFYQR